MKVTVYLADGGVLNIGDFDQASALDMVDAIGEFDTARFATFDMDGALVYVNKAHIVRIDIEDGAAS